MLQGKRDRAQGSTSSMAATANCIEAFVTPICGEFFHSTSSASSSGRLRQERRRPRYQATNFATLRRYCSSVEGLTRASCWASKPRMNLHGCDSAESTGPTALEEAASLSVRSSARRWQQPHGSTAAARGARRSHAMTSGRPSFILSLTRRLVRRPASEPLATRRNPAAEALRETDSG